MSGTVIKLPKLDVLTKEIYQAVENGMHDITDDLLRVATLRSPVDSTTLEKSGTSKVKASDKGVTGQVTFSARNKGFNYALQMDKGSYNLGKKSKAKASKGVKSKFSKTSMKVGSGYLTDSAEKCADGYAKHINAVVGSSIVKAGFMK